jgi:hypothetical protein
MIPQTLNAQIKQSSSNFVIIVTDPCISRIEKNIAQNGPKFLDLDASIYGTILLSINFVFYPKHLIQRAISHMW